MKIQHLSSKFSDYDLFAVQPSFKIKGKDQMASVMGLFLTLFTILSMIALSLYLIVQMIEHTNPNVTNSEVVTNVYNGDSVTISKDNNVSFYFAFALFAEDVITDPGILNITVQANNYTVIPPDQIIPQNSSLSAELCDWYENYGDWDTQGAQGYCIDQDFTLLSGMPGPDHAAKQSLTISFSPCSQSSGLAACKDPENIEKIMSNSEFRVTYTNPSINNNDYKDPVVMNYIDYEEYILPGYTKTLTFFITKVKVVTDNGWFFQSIHEVDAIFVEDQRTTIQPRKGEDSPLFNFVITANDKVLVYNRSYNKIQDVFGEITGLASFIVLVITVFARPFFQFKTTEALVNSVYDVVVKEDAFSSTIGIIDQNSGKDNDKKDDPENDEKQNLKKRSQSLSRRCKSKKVGIEENITRTSTSSILISETPKSSTQKKDGIEHNRTRPNTSSVLISDTPKSSDQIKDVHKRQEQPEPGDLEMCRQETFAGLLKKATGEDPPIVEIEMETGEQKQDDHPLRSSLLLEPRYKINVSFGEWLLSFFRPQLQVKILQEAEETLARNLDLISLSQNMAEINKLKECLLNDQQQILFDNLPHSFMKLESNSKSSKDEGGGERCVSLEANKEGRLKEAYTKLKESQNKSEVDLKLLHLYEKKYSKF